VSSAGRSVRGMNRASPDWGKRRNRYGTLTGMSGAAATEKVRVIVGEDHPLFRDGLVRALTSSGVVDVVAEADDGVAALALIKTHLPHVALLDYRMPGMDGAKVAAAPDMPVSVPQRLPPFPPIGGRAIHPANRLPGGQTPPNRAGIVDASVAQRAPEYSTAGQEHPTWIHSPLTPAASLNPNPASSG